MILWLTAFAVHGLSQTKADTSAFKTVSAGAQYSKPQFYQWLWGKNCRTEWTTPVQARILLLDSVDGGLTPYKTGGGNETKTLHLKSPDGKQYTIRSIDKSRNDVVLPEFKNTFIEDIIDDGVSMSYPYAAFAINVLQEHAGIPHTNPQLVYLPAQPALDTFNKKFGNDLYLFEQKLGGDWSAAENLHNPKYFTATDDVTKILLKDNSNKAVQFQFIKARLFDMLIADWDRHEDNWQWGSEDSISTLYFPIPRDRDQAFYAHNGVLIDRMLSAQSLNFMQNFNDDTKNIIILNYEERNMDRFFANEMTLRDWINAADTLQQALTDDVIEASVHELPSEIFKISGKELIEKLESRRAHLQKYATEYYRFLAKQVDITGSNKSENFEVDGSAAGTTVKIFRIDSASNRDDTAFYERTFYPSETKEIMLYGIDGKDIYKIDNANNIAIKIIGGPQSDSVIESNSSNVSIYDNKKNSFQTSNTSMHLKQDSAIHAFQYDWFNYNKCSISPSFFYDYDDRLYVGLGYKFTGYAWRRSPYNTKQKIDLHYSLSQHAISAAYNAIYPNVFDKWNAVFDAKYDAIRWTNFFGLGNETQLTTTDKDYFRMRTKEWLLSAGLNKNFGKSSVTVAAFFHSVKILNDSERYLSKEFLPLNKDALERNNYIGAQIAYTYLNVDDSVVPVKGVSFIGTATGMFNTMHDEFFQKYYGRVKTYMPLVDKFSLAVTASAATVVEDNNILNSAEFYEHATIGGPESLRGYKRERFWGKSSFYNNNELRYITKLHTHLVNAKAGVLLFFDDGRVWIPNEVSNTLHTAYGAGILFAPFYKFCGTVTYGVSKESKIVQIKFSKLF